jgi:hypothetical protein
MKFKLLDVIEWVGVVTAMVAAPLVAANSGFQGLGYSFYIISSFAVGYVCWKLKRRGLLFLQVYFLGINLLGIWAYSS